MSSRHSNKELSAKPYVIGFVGSLALTLSAYLLITHRAYSRTALVVAIFVLALIQFVVQMVLFLDVGWRNQEQKWRTMVFWFMLLVVVIIVFGSLWIMNNLNYHMSLQQMYQYLNNQGDGI